MTFPVWMQVVIGLAAFVTAWIVLWTKVFNPLRKAGNAAEKMYPLMVRLTEVFADNPDLLAVIYDMASQFSTNSGSSLRDVVNEVKAATEWNRQAIQRVEMAAEENRRAGEVLKVGVETSRLLAQGDRDQLLKLIVLLDRLDAKVSGGRDSLDRMELDRVVVAENLAAAQTQVDKLAQDADDAHARADAVADGAADGAAADAASRSGTEPLA